MRILKRAGRKKVPTLRASDKIITKESGFYALFERDDVVMADRGFQILEDLILHFCNLQVQHNPVKSDSQGTEKIGLT